MIRNTLLLVLLLVWGISAYSQNISGRVVDDKNLALPGATVQLEGTTKGASTDLDGRYVIQNVDPGAYTVTIRFLGFKTKSREIVVEKGKNLTVDFKMSEDSEVLDEVVVIGYGVQRKREVTGSIAKVESKQIMQMPVQSFEAGLQGMASGVQVTTGSGLAGSASVIRVRGIASISAGGDPLYVIDGIPVTQDMFMRGNSGAMNNNPLSSINPNDIESVEVLKDAAATGIYGSRGANGVILITTKRGKKEGIQIDFMSRVGTSQPTARPRMLNSEEYLQLYQEAWENDGNVGRAPLPYGISWEQAEKTNTDWVDETIHTGIKQEYNLGVRFGKGKVKSYIGASYSDNESYLIGNSFQRASARANVDIALTKDIDIAISSSISQGTNNRVGAGWSGGLGSAMSTAIPIAPIFDTSGEYWVGGPNPVRDRELLQWRSRENRTINGISVNYRPTEKLTVTGSGNYDYMDLREDVYEPQLLINTAHQGIARQFPTWVNNFNTSLTANYEVLKSDNHNLSILGGTEYQKSTTRSYSLIEGIDAEKPLYQENVEDSNLVTLGAPIQRWSFMSYFARASYNYQGKYMLQAVGRVDGSSRFGRENRYGFFPSVSAGWIISEEDFMKGQALVNFLKFRTSFGLTGNANIPNYQRFGTFSPPDNQNPYNGQPSLYPIRLENPNLRWETSRVFDAALEIGVFEDKVSMEIGFYHKKTSDVLMDLVVPRSTGFGNYWDNVGEIVNYGIEYTLKTRNITKPNFEWTTDFNIARNYNEITSIGVYTEDAVSGGTNDTRVVVGMPVGTNFLVRHSHVDPATGRPVYLDINGNETFNWDPADRVPVGSVLPKAYGGLTNNFRYKRWDLSLVMIFSIGNDIYDSSSKRQLGVVTDWNMRPELFDRWQQPGDNATYPRLTRETATYGSGTPWINTDLWLHDGSYLRFRNLSLGYTLPDFDISSKTVSNMRIVANVTNFLTLTNFPGLDPEIARDFENDADRNLSVGITYLTPPQERTYNLTVSFTF